MSNLAQHMGLRYLGLAAWILLATSSVAAQQDETIRIETSLVNLNVAVMDRQGRRISGLTKEDFGVFEDGVRQEISYFAADERPLRLVLLFDTSISMEAVLPIVKREADTLIDKLRSNDEVNIVSFASEIRRLSDSVKPEQAKAVVGNLTSEPHPQPVPATIDRTGYRVGDGNTNLYEALQYILANFKANDDRIAVVVFSDGVDTAAGRSINSIRRRADEVGKEVLRYAQESWVLLYPIRYRTEQIIGEMPDPAWRPTRAMHIGSRPKDPGPELFSQIASATGGEVFEWTTQRDLTVALEGVLADLRSQYSIAYTPPRSANRKGFHRVGVKVKRPNMVTRAREGYLVVK